MRGHIFRVTPFIAALNLQLAAAITNGSFETGNFSNWLLHGVTANGRVLTSVDTDNAFPAGSLLCQVGLPPIGLLARGHSRTGSQRFRGLPSATE